MKILVFAPHNDDEVLGVGGTMAKFAAEGHEVYVCEVTSGKSFERLQAEARRAHSLLGVKDSFFLNLPVTQLSTMEQSVLNAAVDKVVRDVQPDIVFVPHRGDMHADHSAVSAAVMVAVRPVSCPSVKKVLAYETLSETEWNIPSVDNAFIPNSWNDISGFIDCKIRAMECYESQIKEFPNPRSAKGIRSLSEFRGSTICVSNAEAFMLIREVMNG